MLEMKKLLLLLFLILINFNASAFSYGDYKNYEDDDTKDAYLLGLQIGVQWTSTTGAEICIPENVSFSLETTKEIIEGFAKDLNMSQTQIDELPIAALLVHGMIDKFPCN